MENKGRILSIDFGLKKTGIAVTDELCMIASGLKTVPSETLMDFLMEYTTKEKVSTIVVGLPKRMDNSDSHVTENVKLLKEALVKQFPLIHIDLYDERFTSKMAFQSMIDGGLSKKARKNKQLIDEISATIILQGYLESIS